MVQNRQTATKQHIREALIQLLLEEKFETISVSKLCQRAGINRGTFYLHYLDKYDLIETLKEEISQLKNQLASLQKLLPNYVKILKKLQTHMT